MKWARHVTCLRDVRNTCKIFVGNPEGERQLGKLRGPWRIILKWILMEVMSGWWTRFMCLRTGFSGEFL
jgi:hypothetical protein